MMNLLSQLRRRIGPRPKPVANTAAILIIGDEILSGLVQDQNVGFLTAALAEIGVHVREVRIVPDDERLVVDSLNTLRRRNAYLFTSGGLGPTHDDITVDAVAKAFSVDVRHHPELERRIRDRYPENALNTAHLRMARLPTGAEPIRVPNRLAPGFWIANVIVMAGVPSIAREVMERVKPRLKGDRSLLSQTFDVEESESVIAEALREIAASHSEVKIGCYASRESGRSRTRIIVQARREQNLTDVVRAIDAMLCDVKNHKPRDRQA